METIKLITVTHFEVLLKVVGCILILLWMRTKFRYSLTNRLYRILVGGNKFHNMTINDLQEEQEDIERFSALYGLNPASTKDIIRFYSWIKSLNLNIKTFSNLGNRFNIERRKVKKTKKIEHVLCYALFYLMFYMTLIIFEVAINKAALIKFHGSDTWVWLTEKSAKEHSYNIFRNTDHDWELKSSDCQQPNFSSINTGGRLNIQPELASKICTSFSDSTITEKLHKTIKEQTFLLIPCFILLYLSLVFLFLEKRLGRSEKARRHILEKTKEYRRARSATIR